MKTHVNSRQMISGLLEQKTLSSVKRRGAAKLCESPEEALGRYRVLMLPLSPSWREAVTLPAPCHKDSWTWQALLVITARNPRVRGLLSALGTLLRCKYKALLCRSLSRYHSLFSLCCSDLQSGQHPAWGSREGGRSQDLTFPLHTHRAVWEGCDMCPLSSRGRKSVQQTSPYRMIRPGQYWCTQRPVTEILFSALAQLFTCRYPWVQRFYFFNHKFTSCCGFPLVNFSSPL